jgi:hypothetical protein
VVDFILLQLKLALREPGCPICRLMHEVERRFLFYVLYENVNDGTTRAHLLHSLGLCPGHAWAMQATEQGRWNDGMGTGAIYEDLTARVLGTLSDYLERSARPGRTSLTRLIVRLFGLERFDRWLKCRTRLGCRQSGRSAQASPVKALLARLSPLGRCRLCETVEQSEKANLGWLVSHLTDPEFRSPYAAADGLCLAHLRGALACAREEETARHLVKSAADRLGLLLLDLKEYGRKHSWTHRDEPKYPWEQASWIRAVAFFAGEAREDQGDGVHRMRRQALTDHRLRPNERPGRLQRPRSPEETGD